MGKCALIVTDMLHDFMNPQGALFCGQHSLDIIEPAAELLAQHRALGSLIIFVQDSHSPDDKEFESFPPHCLAGHPGSGIIPQLAPLAHELVLPKRRFSAFFETNLEDILKQNQIDEVHLCGVCTSICIMETCSDLRARDYSVIVHGPAVADFDQQAHDFALKRMQNILGAKVLPDTSGRPASS